MLVIIALVVTIVVFIVIFFLIKELNRTDERPEEYLKLSDNTGVEEITPPEVFELRPNDTSCNKTPTPCVTTAECRACIEVLATCLTFDEEARFEMEVEGETQEFTINPGESYCMG
jgi:hypothetical protein